METNLYYNSNGKTYLIMDRKGDIALLAQIVKEGEIAVHKYVVAISFDQNVPSWGSGIYFRTYLEAIDKFDKMTY